MEEITKSSGEDFTSKIEVNKLTKGQYTWTIRLGCKDGNEFTLIDKIEILNKEMLTRFKSE